MGIFKVMQFYKTYYMKFPRKYLVIFFFVGILLPGCTTLPDTSGYTAATIQVKQAVATTGDVVSGELRSAIEAKAIIDKNEAIKNFKVAWIAVMKSLDAMVAHAQSIEQIVDAGNKGAESARQVADSVKNLAEAVKVDAITGASAKVVELSAETLAFIYGEYSKHVAAKSLEEALDKFGPSMTRITALIQAQIADARRLFDEQIEAQVQLLNSPAVEHGDVGKRFGNWIKRHEELDEMAQRAVHLLAIGVSNNKTDDIKRAKEMIADIEIGQKMIAPQLAEYKTKLHAIRKREKVGYSIIGSAENAVGAWGISHQMLVKAVKERKPVSVDSLTAAVVEIRTLIQRWREL